MRHVPWRFEQPKQPRGRRSTQRARAVPRPDDLDPHVGDRRSAAPAKLGRLRHQGDAWPLTAGPTSQVNAAGDHATHFRAFNGNRDWTYGYVAPTAPGLVDVFSVVNTVDGDGRSVGDLWGFNGTVVAAQENTRSDCSSTRRTCRSSGRRASAASGVLPCSARSTRRRSVDRGRSNCTAPRRAPTPRCSWRPTRRFAGRPGSDRCDGLHVVGRRAVGDPDLDEPGRRGAGRGQRSSRGVDSAGPRARRRRVQLQAVILDLNAPRPLAITATNGIDATIAP